MRHGFLCVPKKECDQEANSRRNAADQEDTTTLSEVGRQFSETARTPAEIEAYAGAMADMFCAYLKNIETG